MGTPYEIILACGNLRLLISNHLHKIRTSWNCNRHSNADYELHIILRGSCKMDVEDQRYPLSELQAILIPPGLYHFPRPSSGEFERLSIPFTPADGSLKQQLLTKLSGVQIFSITPEMAALCREIFRESEQPDSFHQDMLRILLTKLMIHCFRILNMDDCQCASVQTSENNFSDRIDDFFEVYMSNPVTAEILASELHISRRQLSRILTQTYGMGFREKLIRTRMDRASWLLRNTQKSIPEIAFEVGYRSDAAFFSVFKTHFGCTPAIHRSKSQTDIE